MGSGRLSVFSQCGGVSCPDMLSRIALRRLTSPLGRRYITSMATWGKSLSETGIYNIVEKGNSCPPIDIENRADIRKYEIYAIEIPDAGVTLKRVIQSGDHFMMFADNPNESGFPTCISTNGVGYNPICGRVVWAWNKF